MVIWGREKTLWGMLATTTLYRASAVDGAWAACIAALRYFVLV